jgi:predicted nucleic acid-binding protein
VTRLDPALAGVSTLGLDTSPFIYYIERHPEHLAVMREVVRRIDEGVFTAATSTITLTEVLTRPKQVGNSRLEGEYRALLIGSRNLSLLPIDEAVADEAATLRARHGLRTPDAIQLAAALIFGCEAFLTNDRGLRRVDEIRVLLLDDLEP